ncbi:MAG: hypothetical protein FD123_2791 [Bacteroidetes bacterium]|nr:MAG: hypothetical protein FD123_2791 [Bacteroidota bacterium]
MKNQTFIRQTGAFFAFAFLLHSCKPDPVTIPDLGYNYAPDNVGHYVIYEVDSTVYDDFTGDTNYYHYQLKELAESEFTDNQGRRALRIERWVRFYDDTISVDSLPWILHRVWYSVKTQTGFERMEENTRYLKLVFPPVEDKSWNGNTYNTIGSWDYEYESVDQSYNANSDLLDSTLAVLQRSNINLLEHQYYHERYARNVGLVEKSVVDVFDTALVVGVPVLNRIVGGVKVNYKLLSYGN